MLSFLKNPYPCNYGQKHSLLVAIVVGAFVTAFLYFFKPFGIEEGKYPFSYYLGYGGVTFISVLLAHLITPHIFPKFFDEKNYTVGKEIFLSAVLILIIGLGNAVFHNYLQGNNTVTGIIPMIFNTFLIGIFPLTFLTLADYSRKLKQNLRISEEISLPKVAPTSNLSPPQISKLINLSSEGEHKTIQTDDLLFIEAVGNYANVVELNENSVSRNLFRTTLKSLEEENAIAGIMRCHRSYIVNLNKVNEVKGNAQGLKLHLQDCAEIVPVSRKYIQPVKAYFENLG